MNDKVIIFEDIWKYYPLYHHITAGVKTFLFNMPRAVKQMRNTKFWALKGVSFEVYKGEAFGIMGHNGAGKSTILGLIAGVLKPSKGNVYIFGKVIPLLELGAGFHPELTGRENIVLNMILLGITKKEAQKRIPNIIEFSELSDFIDQPTRIYSSGMLARLGFSVAVYTDPEILLVDEIIAVGDESFQKKCYEKMESFKKKGMTIVLVSHDKIMMERFCDRIMFISKGEVSA